MQYKDQHIDFEFINHFFMTEKEEYKRVQFLNYLKANRELIEDDAIVGLLLFLDKHNWNHLKLEQKLSTLSYPPQKRTLAAKRRKKNNYLKYAASLIIIASTIFSITYFKQQPLSTYFPIETGLPNLMSSHTNQDYKWKKINAAFQNEDYKSVYTTCKEQLLNKIQSDTLLYFCAISAYKLNKYEEAVNYFKEIQFYEESIFLIDSEYMLALALLNTSEKQQGKDILKSMSINPNHPFNLQAAELIKRK